MSSININTSNLPIDFESWQSLGADEQLINGGLGLRFEINDLKTGQKLSAFLIKYDEQYYAYLNQCAHIAMEMDWQAGQFFDADGQRLICATHGAIYDPETGLCVGGPCHGAHLKSIPLRHFNHTLYVPKQI
jgi:nitrite reductase/ring-hydroxylating ferredoxin subunit